VPTNKVIRFLGVLETAEIIPVEPEQGNACAGKVVQHIRSLFFAYATFPPTLIDFMFQELSSFLTN
jgi:hypothetical protein